MAYFKIFNLEKKKFWKQSQLGYCEESNAGQWTIQQIANIGIDEVQIIIPANITVAVFLEILLEENNIGN